MELSLGHEIFLLGYFFVKITSISNSNLSLAMGLSILRVTSSGAVFLKVWIKLVSCQFMKRVSLFRKAHVAWRKAPEFSNHQNL